MDFQGSIACYLHTVDAKKIDRYLDRVILAVTFRPHLVRTDRMQRICNSAPWIHMAFNADLEGAQWAAMDELHSAFVELGGKVQRPTREVKALKAEKAMKSMKA